MNAFTKTVRLGTATTRGGRTFSIFAKIEFTEDGRLSISGVEGPVSGGNCLGGCGQIIDAPVEKLAPGWDHATLTRFRQVWREWHLNDLHAGSPAQRDFLAARKGDLGDYVAQCNALAAAGLDPDPNYLHNGEPYHYGSAWLRKDVPVDILEFLKSLPNADKVPAWV